MIIAGPTFTFIAHVKWGFSVNQPLFGIVWGAQCALSKLPGKIGKYFMNKYMDHY